jgi:hypothetical protein
MVFQNDNVEMKEMNTQTIRDFVREVLNTGTKGHLAYADISPQEVLDIQVRFGLNALNFQHIMEADRIRHIMNEHGSASSEELRGNIAITEDDFALLPNILSEYDSLESVEKSYFGKKRLMYKKALEGTVYCVVEVRGKKQVLSLITLYKTKKENDGSSD